MTPPAIDLLTRIAGDRRRRIERLRAERPAHVLRADLEIRPLGRLERALRRGNAAAPLRLLCEIKHSSPSRGVLRKDLDPVAMAELYQEGGASAISIVTEPDHFHGALEWFDAVRARVSLPLLLKDFVVDSWQILEPLRR